MNRKAPETDYKQAEPARDNHPMTKNRRSIRKTVKASREQG